MRIGRVTTTMWMTTLLVGCVSQASYRSLATPPAPVSDLVASLYLVGDAGWDSPGRDAVLARVRSDLDRHRAETPGTPALVAFLGDNIYDVGARPDHRAEDMAKLAAQVQALPESPVVRGVFLPGNHDWAKGASYEEGETAIEIQQAWLDQMEGDRDVRFMPSDECPGPATVHVADDVHVVFIDTEWLLRRPEGLCGGADRFYDDLTRELAHRRGERIVLAAHHPMVTGGPHGGNVGLFHNGPLVYYLAVKSGASVQDPMSPTYDAMLDRMRRAVAESGVRPLAMAAGHDHSLQVIRMDGDDEPAYQLVSGSASKSSVAGRIDGTRYATSAHGFMRMDFTERGTRLVVFALDPEEEAVVPVFACRLSDGATETCAEAPLMEGGP